MPRNISKDFSVDNMKKTGLNGDVYHFSVDYDAIAVNDILDIHKYLKQRYDIVLNVCVYKKVFVESMTFFGCNVLNLNPLKCVSMNNQECEIGPEMINVNINESPFYLYSIEIDKCSGSCYNINDPYASVYVPDIIKNINV